MRRGFLLLGLVGVAFAASCGLVLDYGALQNGHRDAGASGGAGGGDAGTGIALDQLAPVLAQAFCDNVNACYVSAVELLIHDEDCVPLFRNIIAEQVVAPIQASVDRGTLTYDPAGGAECVRRLTAATVASPLQCLDINTTLEDCKSMLGKLAGSDQPCRERFECEHGLQCKLDTCPGACAPYAGVGAACAQNSDCDPTQDLYCDTRPDTAAGGAGGAGGTPVCAKRIPLDAACTNRQECVTGAFCISGTCKPIRDVFTLAQTFSCWGDGVLCQATLSCEFSGLPLVGNGTCVKEKALAGACRFALPDECPKGSYCNVTSIPLKLNGQCVASPSENQTCATDLEQSFGIAAPCAAGLACVNGLCKPLRHLSNPCEANQQCYSGACAAPSSGAPKVCVLAGCP